MKMDYGKLLQGITFGSAIILMGYVFFQMVYPFEIVELKNFTVTSPHVAQGEPVSYTLAFDKKMNVKPDIRYYFLSPNHQAIEVVATAINRKTGDQTVQLALDVPDSVPVGCGKKLQIDLSYKLIFGRPINYSWISNEFCITLKEQL